MCHNLLCVVIVEKDAALVLWGQVILAWQEPLVDQFCHVLRSTGVTKVATGRFGADMKVALVNDGPVTLIIDTPEK